MNSMLLVICTFWLLDGIITAVYARKHNALIFNRVTLTPVYQPEDTIRQSECDAWASACLAQSSADEEFIEEYSVTKKALFVKRTYEKGSPANEVQTRVCDNPFELSVAFDIMKYTFEFGYEVFYKKSDDSKFDNRNYENYITAERAVEIRSSLFKTGLLYGKEFFERFKRIVLEEKKPNQWYNENEKMMFTWVPIFRLRYDFSKLILKHITYEIRRNNKLLVQNQCEDYTLGSSMYKDYNNVNSLYNNEDEVFKRFKLPPTLICTTANPCLEKWSLIPIHQFHLYYSSPILCTHMTTIPIWRETVKGVLEKLNKYLYALFKIFVGLSKLSSYEDSTYENYRTVEQAIEIRKNLFNTTKHYGKEFIFQRPLTMLTTYKKTNKPMWYHGGEKMMFIWIPTFRLRFNFSKLILKHITYDIYRNNKQPGKDECENYSLDSDMYKDYTNNLETLYKNEDKIFEKFTIPTPPCPSNACPRRLTCTTNKPCLEKWSLIPIDQFHVYRSSTLLCSQMTTIPIWKGEVKTVLEKLDRYLYAMSRHLRSPLHVSAGVRGELELPKKGILPFQSQPVYLDTKKKIIPIPKLIYYFVKYVLPDCESADDICEYSAIILIHNEPNFETKNKLCTENKDVTATWGWEEITKDEKNMQHENIYVCPDDSEVLEKIFGKISLSKPKSVPGNMNLIQFPFFAENKSIGKMSIQEKVSMKFQEIFVEGKDDSDQNDIIEQSLANNNDIEILDDDDEENKAEISATQM